jgi:three-Cys-motif partner protein
VIVGQLVGTLIGNPSVLGDTKYTAMPLDNSDPEKWRMKEHTEVKHEILRKYLRTWARIRSSTNSSLHYFDGFAGRAIYDGERRGSPLLALEVAEDLAERVENFYLTFNELNDENFDDMKEGVEKRRDKCQKPDYRNEPFEDVAPQMMEDEKHRYVPSLVFVDPFGYDSVPFETVSEIMNMREQGDEVFFTFMVEKIRRFLKDEEKESAISKVLGTDNWKYIRDIKRKDRKEEEILQLYVSQLEDEADVKHVFPFKMMHSEKRSTAYYLIHATNHFKGLKVMKDVMFNEGAEGNFAYLGQDHHGFEEKQMDLFESTETKDNRVADLENHFLDTFEGERASFWDILKESYADAEAIESHYKKAIRNLEEKDKALIHNFENRPDGTRRGLGHDDEVEFTEQNKKLDEFF